MTAAQRKTMDHLHACHGQLDAEAQARDTLGAGWFDYPPPPRVYLEPVSVWTQYRAWLFRWCQASTYAAILALGIYMGLVADGLAMGVL